MRYLASLCGLCKELLSLTRSRRSDYFPVPTGPCCGACRAWKPKSYAAVNGTNRVRTTKIQVTNTHWYRSFFAHCDFTLLTGGEETSWKHETEATSNVNSPHTSFSSYSGSRDGVVVIALASHLRRCLRATSGFSWLLVLYSAPRGFSLGFPVFPSPQKSTFPNSNSIGCRTSL